MAKDNRTLSYPYLGDPARPHLSPHSNALAALRAEFHGRISNEGATDTVTIPDSMEALTEAIQDEKWRKAVFGDAEKTQEFLREYTKQMNKGDAIARQTSEEVTATLTQFLKDHGVTDFPTKAELTEIAKGAYRASGRDIKGYNPQAPGAALDSLGFANVGEVAQFALDREGRYAGDEKLAKLREISAQYSSTDPASAGLLIPEEFRATILQMALEQAVVRPRATVITMGSRTLEIPFVDVTTHSGSLFGGMIFYWTAESAALTAEEASFGRVKLEASKLTGLAAIPNELKADAPALGSFLDNAMPAGLAHYEDQGFVSGSGTGEPLGFRNSDAIISVTRAGANAIATADIASMYARMLPQALGRAVWVANQTTLPQLIQLSLSNDAIGVIGDDITRAPMLSLLGRPVVISEKVPALGSAGDLNFVDFSSYLIGDRQAVSIDSSEHSRFRNDETDLRIIERVDGRPWVQSALTPLNGDTLSPVVELAA